MLLVICNYTKDNFLWEPKKINFKFHGNRENTGKIVMRKISSRKIQAFEVCFSLSHNNLYLGVISYILFHLFFLA